MFLGRAPETWSQNGNEDAQAAVSRLAREQRAAGTYTEAYRYAEEHIKRCDLLERVLDEERQAVGGALNELASAVLGSAASPHSLVALANKARNALLCPKEVTPGGRKCVHPRGHDGGCVGC